MGMDEKCRNYDRTCGDCGMNTKYLNCYDFEPTETNYAEEIGNLKAKVKDLDFEVKRLQALVNLSLSKEDTDSALDDTDNTQKSFLEIMKEKYGYSIDDIIDRLSTHSMVVELEHYCHSQDGCAACILTSPEVCIKGPDVSSAIHEIYWYLLEHEDYEDSCNRLKDRLEYLRDANISIESLIEEYVEKYLKE